MEKALNTSRDKMYANGTKFNGTLEKATLEVSNYKFVKAHLAAISDAESTKHHGNFLLVQSGRKHKVIAE